MARFHYWQRDCFHLDSSTAFLSSDPVVAGTERASRRTDDTFTRGIWQPTFTCLTGSTSPPPEQFWRDVQVFFVATFDQLGRSVISNPTGNESTLLAASKLQPREYASPTAPTEYRVIWEDPRGVVTSEGQRKGGGEPFPTVNWGFMVLDFHSWLAPTTGFSLATEAWAYGSVLWASTAAF